MGYLFLGDAVVGALYQTGQFGVADTLATWGVLAAFSLGLTATASSRVLSSAFYALRDTRTPARIAYLRVGVATVSGLILMFPLDRYGVGSLRLGAARKSLVVKLAGGAAVADPGGTFNIGQRNLTVVKKLLWKNGIFIAAEEVGANHWRNMRLEIASGRVWVKDARGEFELQTR